MKRKILLLTLCLTLVLVAEPREIISDGTTKPTMQTPRRLIDIQKPLIGRKAIENMRGVLWAQIPDTTAPGHACQLDSINPFEADICDDIEPTGSGWAIDSVTSYWSNWNGFSSWANVPNIHFLVYADSGIATPHPVDSPFVEVVVQQANYTATQIAAGVNGVFRVDMELPSTVVLPGGVRYWIEVQPSMDFSVGGQTGWQEEVAIGNGQESYNRFPLLGTDPWATATTTFGSTYEAGFILYGSIVSYTITWDFETGLQGWTHTNGLAFPEAWAVQPSGLHSLYTPPAAGDSSMWIDSDAAGSGSTVHDTALSPVLIPNTATTDWLWYGFGFNNLGSDFLEVGIKYFDGSTWTVVPLRTYTADTVGADSIDVSAYNTYQWIQVYFYYDAPGWDWYAVFDNVTIDAEIYVPEHDVGAIAINEPGSAIDPYTPFTPTATFKNFGNNAETFDAYYLIDSAGSVVYSQTVSLTLNPGDDSTHMFPGYTSAGVGVIYDIFAYTILAGDGNPGNDTTYQQTHIFLNELVSEWTDAAPTIDGTIDTLTEWSNAGIYDISDIMGIGGAGISNNPGDCLLYLMNDSNYLYMAVDYVADISLEDYDQFGPYFDENHDGAWDTDSTEGNFWFYWDGSNDLIVYRSIPDYTQRPAPGVSYQRTLVGHQRYEVSIPLGDDTRPNFQNLNYSQFPDTFGFYIYALDNATGDYGGYWPTGGCIWDDPSTYGDILLSEWTSGIGEDEERPSTYELSLGNSIVHSSGLEIKYTLPRKSDISIGVYDAMGRVVYSLRKDDVEAGWYELKIANDIPSGIYFVNMKAGEFSQTKKAILFR